MKSPWKNQKMVEEPGAPWRETTSTGPIPQCMSAGTETQVCPEQTTVRLSRYGCHEHACEPPTHPNPIQPHPWCAGSWGGAQSDSFLLLPSSSDRNGFSLTYLSSLKGAFTPKCYLVSLRLVKAEASMLGFAERPTGQCSPWSA